MNAGIVISLTETWNTNSGNNFRIRTQLMQLLFMHSLLRSFNLRKIQKTIFFNDNSQFWLFKKDFSATVVCHREIKN